MRLTNDIRASVINKAIAHRFAEEEAAHLARRTEFGKKLYEHTFAEEASVVAGFSTDWWTTQDDLHIRQPDFEHHYRRRYGHGAEGVFWGAEDKEHSVIPLPAPATVPRDLDDISIDKTHPLYRDACELAKAGHAFRKRRDEAREQLSKLLQTFQTDTKLFEVWPEGKQFFGAAEKKTPAKAMVPAQLAARVNALLNLEKKA